MFGTKGLASVLSPNAAILISMLSTAYMAHYNAPKFYWDLQERRDYRKVVYRSFGTSMVLMSLIGVAGFLTFGGASQSLILNNYAATDALMSWSRLAVTLSLIFTYPLVFVGVREGFMDLIQLSPVWRSTPAVMEVLTVALLSVITFLAWALSDIRVILSLGGATWGNLLVYVFPSIMMVHAAKSHPELQGNVPLSIGTGILGLAMGIVGTVKAIRAL
jgi:amino acid permease